MKARIIVEGSTYSVERWDADANRWRYVRQSAAATLEQAEIHLRLFQEVGEPPERIVIREVEY
jgi:hypothetical protein